LVGWSLYRHRDLLERFTAGWKTSLAVGQLVVLPAALVCLYLAIKAETRGGTGKPPWQVLAMLLLALYTWLSIGGLMGLFLKCLSRERAWIRWMADSSYWCYLTSMPLIVFLNYVAFDWPVPAPVKFLFVSVAALLILLTSYQSFVRYTWIGAMLNGHRARPAPRDVREVVAVS
jgi:peptidoglycan/LPS O-acetylase OafA/YrhL